MSNEYFGELTNDPYKVLEEIDAWLSFNQQPSVYELRQMRKTITACLDKKKARDSMAPFEIKKMT